MTEIGVRSDDYAAVLSQVGDETIEHGAFGTTRHVATWGATDLVQVAVRASHGDLLRVEPPDGASFRHSTAGIWREDFGVVQNGPVKWCAPEEATEFDPSMPFRFGISLRLPPSLRSLADPETPLGERAVRGILGGSWLATFNQIVGRNEVDGRLVVSPLVGLDEGHVVLVGRGERPDLFCVLALSIVAMRREALGASLSEDEVARIAALGVPVEAWQAAPLFDGCTTWSGVALDPNPRDILVGPHAERHAGRYAICTRYRGERPTEVFRTRADEVLATCGYFDARDRVASVESFTVGQLVARLLHLKDADRPVLTHTEVAYDLRLEDICWPSGGVEDAFRQKWNVQRDELLRTAKVLSRTAEDADLPHGLEESARALVGRIARASYRDPDGLAPLLPLAHDLASATAECVERRYHSLADAVVWRTRRGGRMPEPLEFDGYPGYRVSRDAFSGLMSDLAKRGGLKPPLVLDGAVSRSTLELIPYSDETWVMRVPVRGHRMAATWSNGVHELGHALAYAHGVGEFAHATDIDFGQPLKEAIADFFMHALLRLGPADATVRRDAWLLLGPRLFWERSRHPRPGRKSKIESDTRSWATRALVTEALVSATDLDWATFRNTYTELRETRPEHVAQVAGASWGAPELQREPWKNWDELIRCVKPVLGMVARSEPPASLIRFRRYLDELRPLLLLDPHAWTWPKLVDGTPGPSDVVLTRRRRFDWGSEVRHLRYAFQATTSAVLLDLEELTRPQRLSAGWSGN